MGKFVTGKRNVKVNRPTYIYALCCPDTGDVRYVGKTVNSLQQRLDGHLRENSKTHKANWVRSVINKYGKPPIIYPLEIVCPGYDWVESEMRWIQASRMLGFALCNVTAGGEGMVGYSPTPETRRKISIAGKGHITSLETRLKISKANSGNIYNRGRKHSIETCRKVSLAKIGHTHSEETKLKISKALIGVSTGGKGRTVSPETCKRLSIAHTGKVLSEQHKMSIAKSCTGRVLSEESRKKISKSKLGKKRGPQSQEWRDNISKSMKKFKSQQAEIVQDA